MATSNGALIALLEVTVTKRGQVLANSALRELIWTIYYTDRPQLVNLLCLPRKKLYYLIKGIFLFNYSILKSGLFCM